MPGKAGRISLGHTRRIREPVETTTPFDRGARRLARRALIGGAARLGVKVEPLDDSSAFVRDGSTHLPELLGRAAAIPGMVPLRRGTFLYLVAYASAIEGDIVEVGSWHGRSTLFLAQACADTNNGVVHAIDTFQGTPSTGDRYAKGAFLEAGFRENMERAGLAERVVLHPKRSAAARAEIQGPLRMLFIDGEHTYEAVRADLAFVDLLAAGGVVAFDDYNPLFEGVVQAVQEFVAERKVTRPVQVRNMLVTRLP